MATILLKFRFYGDLFARYILGFGFATKWYTAMDLLLPRVSSYILAFRLYCDLFARYIQGYGLMPKWYTTVSSILVHGSW